MLPSGTICLSIQLLLWWGSWLATCMLTTGLQDVMTMYRHVIRPQGPGWYWVRLACVQLSGVPIALKLSSVSFMTKCAEDGSLKVLGMQWLSSGDCFSFSGVVVPDDLCDKKVLSWVVLLVCLTRWDLLLHLLWRLKSWFKISGEQGLDQVWSWLVEALCG